MRLRASSLRSSLGKCSAEADQPKVVQRAARPPASHATFGSLRLRRALAMLKKLASSAALGSASASSGSSVAPHHKYSVKFPPVPKNVTDEAEKKTFEGFRECAMSVIDYMIEDPSCALGLFQDLQKARAKAANVVATVDRDDQFSEVTTVGKLEPSWIIQVVSEISDLSVVDIVAATKMDDQSPRHLLAYATAWMPSTKIPHDGIIKEVLKGVVIDRHTMLGSRLAKFKKNKGLKADKSLNWKFGCYRLDFMGPEPGAKLKSITHCSGAIVPVEAGGVIDRSWAISHNWSDWEACVVCRPLKPSPLYKFFEQSKTGPYAFKKIAGESSEFKAAVTTRADAFHAKHQPKADEKGVEAAVAQQLAEMQTDKRKKGMEEVRKKALETVSVAKRRRTLTMQKTE